LLIIDGPLKHLGLLPDLGSLSVLVVSRFLARYSHMVCLLAMARSVFGVAAFNRLALLYRVAVHCGALAVLGLLGREGSLGWDG
jgi:hypothetical protein